MQISLLDERRRLATIAALAACAAGCASSSGRSAPGPAPIGREPVPPRVTFPIEEAPASAPKPLATNTLRIADLIEVMTPAGELDGVLRLATATRLGPGRSRVEVHELALSAAPDAARDLTLGEPGASIEVEFDVTETGEDDAAARWRVVDVDDRLLAVLHDAAAERLLLLDVESGRTLFEKGSCRTLEDARARDGGVDVIVRTTEGLQMFELGPTGTVRGFRELQAPDAERSVASFVHGAPGEESPHEAVVVGFKAGLLVAVRADLATGDARSFVVRLTQPRESSLRVTAWGSGGLRRIAIGMPDAYGFGRVALVSDDVDQRPALVHDVFRREVTAAVLAGGALALPSRFGDSVAFADDMDGDGLPELLVGVELDQLSRDGTVAAALVDHARGVEMRRYVRGGAPAVDGADSVLSVDPSGRFLAIAREDVGGRGVAVVTDLRESPTLPRTTVRPAPRQ